MGFDFIPQNSAVSTVRARCSWAEGYKNSLKLDLNKFRPEQSCNGISKFNLNNLRHDHSFLHEFLIYRMYQELGIAAPRAALARVFVNGHYAGLYSLLEQVDKTFLTSNFPDGGQGDLWKSRNWNFAGRPDWKKDIQAKTNESDPDTTAIMDFVGTLNRQTGSGNAGFIAEYFRMEDLLKIFAVDFLTRATDHPFYGIGHNFYIYRDTVTKKFTYIPWDYDQTFSPELEGKYALNYAGGNETGNPLIWQVLNDPDWKKMYRQTVCLVLDSVFNEDWIRKELSIVNLIRESVREDPGKAGTFPEFELLTDPEGKDPSSLAGFVRSVSVLSREQMRELLPDCFFR